MASHVQVILTEDVEALGKAGDVVRVKPGFARNYLLPRSLAVRATSSQVARIEHERSAVLARISRMKKEAEQVAEQLTELELPVEKPAGEGGKLYGSVTAREVAEALRARGFDIDHKNLVLPGAIKQLGEYEVEAKLGKEVKACFKLLVGKQE